MYSFYKEENSFKMGFLNFSFKGAYSNYYTDKQKRKIGALIYALDALRNIMITHEKYADDVRVLAGIHSVFFGKNYDIIIFFRYALYVIEELNREAETIMTMNEYTDIKNNYFMNGGVSTSDVDMILRGLFKYMNMIIKDYFVDELYEEVNRLIDFTLSGLPPSVISPEEIEEYNPPLDDFVETFLYRGDRPVVSQIRGHLGVTEKMMDDYFKEYFDLA